MRALAPLWVRPTLVGRIGARGRTHHAFPPKMAVLGNDAKWDEVKLFGNFRECERVAVEVGVEGEVVGRRGSGVWVEVYGSAVGVFVDSVPGCEWDGVYPSWSFSSASFPSPEPASPPAVCECDVVW